MSSMSNISKVAKDMKSQLKKSSKTFMNGVFNKISDVRLNKSGTMGTEPIAKKDKNGKMRKYIEVKAGRLGKFDIPTRRTY